MTRQAAHPHAHRPRRSGMRRALPFLLALLAGNASAQWLVHDPATFAATQGGFAAQLAKSIDEYALQARQYTTQLEQLQNMLTSIEGLGAGITLAPAGVAPLGAADAARIIQQECPGAGAGGGAGALAALLHATLDRPIAEAQHTLCTAIAEVEIDEYNLTAAALAELGRQSASVRKLQGIVAGIGSFGQAASANAEAQAYLADLHTASATWKNRMDADQAMLAALRRQQSSLARLAMKGRPGPAGDLLRVAAFAAAFR